MRILLIGEVYSSNLGDGVICETAYSIIKKKYKNMEVEFFDLTFRNYFLKYEDFTPIFNEKNNKIKIKQVIFDNFFNNNFGEFIIKYKEIQHNKDKLKILCKNQYNLCIFAGGSLFMDYFCLSIYKIIKICSKNEIPIVFNACGISKNENIILKKLLANALNKNIVKNISLRDGYEDFEKRYHYKDKIIKTHDIAINCAEEYNVKKSRCSKIVGLGVMYIKDYEKDLIIFWENIINSLKKRKIKYKIFCNGDIYDYNFIKQLEDKGIFEVDKIEKRPERPKDLISLIANYSRIISFRLHSHIIAASLEIPSVAVVWNAKVIEFFKQINRSQYCFYINTNVEEIIDCVCNADVDKNKITNMKNRSKKNLEYMISEVLYTYK
ncbi:hypothetical protein B5E91_11530 [Thomasclavelia spiroformis]|uniref:Polysaccharide pyruvyl transferase domain-containing protein n=1 Tax=Thomasclavelia spiroformis TaxID=29348 RepID=A0A1Y4QHU0_9FIRM|nr:polysaccharide pyruvyl transferase family protein [Thomasclavelia spiroformis]OUQ04142.1 hypothetical protein B5E91_11530 [Thomasclavelia spiroformis]